MDTKLLKNHSIYRIWQENGDEIFIGFKPSKTEFINVIKEHWGFDDEEDVEEMDFQLEHLEIYVKKPISFERPARADDYLPV